MTKFSSDPPEIAETKYLDFLKKMVDEAEDSMSMTDSKNEGFDLNPTYYVVELEQKASRRKELLKGLNKYIEDEVKAFICPFCNAPRFALPHAEDCELAKEIA